MTAPRRPRARSAGWALATVLVPAVLWLGGPVQASGPPPAGCTFGPGTVTCVYAYTGTVQTFTVPAGVTTVTLTAWGGAGGPASTPLGGQGGAGAQVQGVFPVTPGDTLHVTVAGYGDTQPFPGALQQGFGYGFGGSGLTGGGEGGGASAVTDGSQLLLVAGGGGGGGAASGGCWGGAGGTSGAHDSQDGRPGDICRTGVPAPPGGLAAKALSPDGTDAVPGPGSKGGGGGGGGGYRGGTGGTSSSMGASGQATGAAGGGAGSSYAAPFGRAITVPTRSPFFSGLVQISYSTLPHQTLWVDTTKPQDHPVLTRTPTGVSVAWNWTDAGSGIDPGSCQQSSSQAGVGAVLVTSTCADRDGNVATDRWRVENDWSGPTDSPHATWTTGRFGWVDADVTVSWSWYDEGSGVDPAHCTQATTSAGEGVQTLSATCTDQSGNSTTDSRVVRVDKTPPTDAPVVTMTRAGATVAWNWTDSLSGLDPLLCTQTSSQSLTGRLTLISSCTDEAGNTATDSRTVDVPAG